MSAGPFIETTYESNQGTLYPARVQQETLDMTIDGVANSPAAGPIPAGVPSANMRGSRRQNGITARSVSLKLPPNAPPPTGYTGDNLVVPVLTASLWAAISRSSTVVYLDTTWRVAGTQPEEVR